MGATDGDTSSQTLMREPRVRCRRSNSEPRYLALLPATRQRRPRLTGGGRALSVQQQLFDPQLWTAEAGFPGALRAPIPGSQWLDGAYSAECVAGQGLCELVGRIPSDNPSSSLSGSLSPSESPNYRTQNYKTHRVILGVILGVVILSLLITVVVLAVSLPGCSPALFGPACPDIWVGYQGKCFYFSEGEGNWTDSRSSCSALGASLAGINTQQEMDFLLHHKGKFDHWIGLRRDPGQLWKWTNGTEFNNLFNIRGGGDCAYLNDENGVGSSRCTGELSWICSKPDVFTAAKETLAGGGS